MREHRHNTGASGAIRSRRVVAKAPVSDQLVPAVSLPAGPISPRVSLSPLSPCVCRYRACFAAPATAYPLQCHWSWQCPSASAPAHHAQWRGGVVERLSYRRCVRAAAEDLSPMPPHAIRLQCRHTPSNAATRHPITFPSRACTDLISFLFE